MDGRRNSSDSDRGSGHLPEEARLLRSILLFIPDSGVLAVVLVALGGLIAGNKLPPLHGTTKISPDSIHAAEAVLAAFAETRRADLAIEDYEKTAGLEGDQHIQVWHLLFSLMDLCESSGSDFDAILRKAQQATSRQAQDAAASEFGSPTASRVFLLLVDLVAYCKAHGIDFAEITADVRAERPTVNGEDVDPVGKMTMLNREKARAEILEAVRQMARDYPDATYSKAREQSGLLGRIKQICGNAMPTAQRCWIYVGLDRSKLVDEFSFAQDDLKNAKRPKLYPYQEKALEALRQNPAFIVQTQ